jgi:hypothetical protein
VIHDKVSVLLTYPSTGQLGKRRPQHNWSKSGGSQVVRPPMETGSSNKDKCHKPTMPQLREELHDAGRVNPHTFASPSTHKSSLGQTSHQSDSC